MNFKIWFYFFFNNYKKSSIVSYFKNIFILILGRESMSFLHSSKGESDDPFSNNNNYF